MGVRFCLRQKLIILLNQSLDLGDIKYLFFCYFFRNKSSPFFIGKYDSRGDHFIFAGVKWSENYPSNLTQVILSKEAILENPG